MPAIEVHHLRKTFEDSIAIEDISFSLPNGCLFTLLGPSGSGKTTILRLLAGLIKPDSGTILFDEKDISNISTEKRNIGFVFQSYALFPHLTVAQNIAFGLDTKGWPKEKQVTRIKEMLELVNLQGKGKRYPRELSGGEQSRVALARALAPEPTVLFLDEPLSALDKSLKEDLQKTFRRIQQTVGVTTIYVTHDQSEAMEISDRILILRKGCVVESGTPEELYLSPKKRFTAEFLGISNIVTGEIQTIKGEKQLTTSFGSLTLPEKRDLKTGKNYSVAIFPEHLQISTTARKEATNQFTAIINKSYFNGSDIELSLKVKNITIIARLRSSGIVKTLETGKEIYLTIPPSSIHLLEED
jgi:ABC-type Fe3+/spermidine/putrescine transport system ATPase subunit